MKKCLYLFFTLLLFVSCDKTNYDQGYQNGYNNGKADGYNEGNAKGYSEGEKLGYDKGYAAGSKGQFKNNSVKDTFLQILSGNTQVISWISCIIIGIILLIVIFLLFEGDNEYGIMAKIIAIVIALLISIVSNKIIVFENLFAFTPINLWQFIIILTVSIILSFLLTQLFFWIKTIAQNKLVYFQSFFIFINVYILMFLIFFAVDYKIFFSENSFLPYILISSAIGMLLRMIIHLLRMATISSDANTQNI